MLLRTCVDFVFAFVISIFFAIFTKFPANCCFAGAPVFIKLPDYGLSAFFHTSHFPLPHPMVQMSVWNVSAEFRSFLIQHICFLSSCSVLSAFFKTKNLQVPSQTQWCLYVGTARFFFPRVRTLYNNPVLTRDACSKVKCR